MATTYKTKDVQPEQGVVTCHEASDTLLPCLENRVIECLILSPTISDHHRVAVQIMVDFLKSVSLND